MQSTSTLLMIRPYRFTFNKETAVNNTFQSAQDTDAHELALKEFDDFASLLQQHAIDVTVVQDSPTPHTPDSIFPNNWVSFHKGGTMVTYPMYAFNRRMERKSVLIHELEKKFRITEKVDLSHYESTNQFLEGTGSLVLDRENKIAYACLSPRTHATVLEDFSQKLGYRIVSFVATDSGNIPIYHTNVMMCVADQFVVICLDAIAHKLEREKVVNEIEATKKEVIPITVNQMNHFAGNMLQVHNQNGEKIVVLSSQAYHSLSSFQLSKLETFNRIVHAKLETIERNGGGSARCMLAEVFLDKKLERL